VNLQLFLLIIVVITALAFDYTNGFHDTANAMAQTERLALQSDLAWVGEYNGAITGDVSERMVAAIKEYQKAKGGKPTGVLNPQERSVLAETARRRQENVGWKIVTDAVTGARLGIPTKLVPQQTGDANGTKWSSPTGTIQINDVFVDERGIVYTVDRHVGGLYILEMDF